ncbi:MAG TPA: 2Fe-2S iron-sulfur cluster-binding protein [Vicinamibacteria bacterium]|nr:2Fe-2S iron-sulfur cluster-binding protein [Vicinamibacteria bacterium]
MHSYHRPTRIEEAQELAAQGVTPLAGGTRVLSADAVVPNVVDLVGLGLTGLRVEDEDLDIGAATPLQDVVDSPIAHAVTGGLLPAACRAAFPSRLLRSMATIGGEACHDDPDSELAAALLALNAVFLVSHAQEPRESPALRFLRSPATDLAGGGILRSVLIPGAHHGAALERAAALPSMPPLVAVAVTATFSGEKLARVRLAVTGLVTPPARIIEAEAQLERTAGEDDVLERAADLVCSHAAFRDDAWATALDRRRIARPLARRALRAALERGRRREGPERPRLRPLLPHRAPAPMPYFTSGRLELTVNGRVLRADAEARTTLLDLLRSAGIYGVKAGCGTGRCGACAALLDGRPVASCLTLAVRAQGRAVVTVEGLGTADRPHPLQEAFTEAGASQCGFCTPGLVLGARALLDAQPSPTEDEVRDALAGLCRCTGYARPLAAVLAAASLAPGDDRP